MAKQYLSVEEIADELGIHPETVRTWIRNRDLPALQLKRTYRIRREDYEKFLHSRYTGKKDEQNR